MLWNVGRTDYRRSLLVVADEDEAAERAAGTSVVGPGRARACSAVAIDQVVLTDRELKLFGKPAAQQLPHSVDNVDAERTAEHVLPDHSTYTW